MGNNLTVDDRQTGTLTAMHQVRKIYPGALCIPRSTFYYADGSQIEGKGWKVFKIIWTPTEGLGHDTFGSTVDLVTDEEAWEFAWDLIQQNMLTKLEEN